MCRPSGFRDVDDVKAAPDMRPDGAASAGPRAYALVLSRTPSTSADPHRRQHSLEFGERIFEQIDADFPCPPSHGRSTDRACRHALARASFMLRHISHLDGPPHPPSQVEDFAPQSSLYDGTNANTKERAEIYVHI